MSKNTLEGKNDTSNGVRLAVFVILAILLQIALLYLFFLRLEESYTWISQIISVFAAFIVLGIYGQHSNASMKMPWIILILTFPFFGVFLYLTIGLNRGTHHMRRVYGKIDEQLFPLLPDSTEKIGDLAAQRPDIAGQFRYLQNYARYPVYGNTDVIFYDDAARGLEAQLEDLKQARSFIFMEYHAIEDSISFKPLHNILKQKAAEGVNVRLFYDYVGSMGFIGNSFADKMNADGIKCRVFNPMHPAVNFFLNNRDHRKITVIDGKVGYTGGYNLADEYFHVTKPFGHWLDTGLRLEGDAVRSLTMTFLENWNSIRADDKNAIDKDVSGFFPEYEYTAAETGLIQPYGCSPLDEERTGENVYINILRNAKRYAWFITPYLIITDEMREAFGMAAKSGADVRIITPGIPDKKIIYSVTRSYYAGLARNGVRIFEYSPGFCHAKQCVVDDEIAICGTINLDFRSLYHHFENGALFYDYKAVQDMKTMFEETFPKCRDVTGEYRSGRSATLRFQQLILRLFAPLM